MEEKGGKEEREKQQIEERLNKERDKQRGREMARGKEEEDREVGGQVIQRFV